MGTRAWPVFLVSAAAVGASLSLQTLRAGQQALRSRVDLVQVDVVVVDRAGRSIQDLQARDFRVFEDDAPVEVVDFREVAPAAEAPANAGPAPVGALRAANNEPNDGRLLVLVLDDEHVRFSPRPAARTREIGRRIIAGLTARDRVALIGTSGRLALQVDFTNDRARLLSAIDAFSPRADSGGSTPADAAATAWRVTSALVALAHLVERLGPIPNRRKSIVLVGSGVPYNLEGTARNPTARNMQDQFTDLIRIAQRQNVVFYAFDPNVMDGSTTDGQRNLRALAENTGGFANVNNNTFAPGVDRFLEESGHHYFLAYSSPAAQDGKYHRIRVQVARPGLTVRARLGYAAAKVGTPVLPSTTLEAAISAPLPVVGFPLQLTAVALPGPDNLATVVVTGVATGTPAGAELRALVLATDMRGNVQAEQRFTVATPASGPTGAEPVRFEGRLLLRPGRYMVRAAVGDTGTNTFASIYDELQIPAPDGDVWVGGITVGPVDATLVVRVVRPAATGTVRFTTSLMDARGRLLREIGRSERPLDGAPETAGITYRVPLPGASLATGASRVRIEVVAQGRRAIREAALLVRGPVSKSP